MVLIFVESGLCGMHCLNTLLQNPKFSEVSLMKIASHLDESERKVMAEMGHETKDFLQYMSEESGNIGDDGNFSVQGSSLFGNAEHSQC